MKTQSKVLAMLALGAFLASWAGSAVADDINIPDWWWDGDAWADPARTFQGWEFEVDPGPIPGPIPIPPDFGNNLNGPGLAPLDWDPGPDGWISELNPIQIQPYDPRMGVGGSWVGTGIVALSGTLDIPIWNDPTPREEKKVQIQLTWAPQDGMPTPFPIIGVTDIQPFGLDNSMITEPVEISTILLGGGWTHSTYAFSIFPNPEYEVFRIGGDIYVDELVIDTYCVPEPASLSLLVLGGLSLMTRRRR